MTHLVSNYDEYIDKTMLILCKNLRSEKYCTTRFKLKCIHIEKTLIEEEAISDLFLRKCIV